MSIPSNQEIISYFRKKLSLPSDFAHSDSFKTFLKGEGSEFVFGITLLNFFEMYDIPVNYQPQEEFDAFPTLISIIEYVEATL